MALSLETKLDMSLDDVITSGSANGNSRGRGRGGRMQRGRARADSRYVRSGRGGRRVTPYGNADEVLYLSLLLNIFNFNNFMQMKNQT
jgi:hypothetical protein